MNVKADIKLILFTQREQKKQNQQVGLMRPSQDLKSGQAMGALDVELTTNPFTNGVQTIKLI